MAKSKSLFRLKGSLGEVTFSVKDGEQLAQLKQEGISKKQIMQDPRFKRTRENLQEFGGSAIAGKALRALFYSYLANMADRRITYRVVQLLKQVLNEDDGERGRRTIDLKTNTALIEGFDWKLSVSFSYIMLAPYQVVVNSDRNEGLITLPAFNPAEYIKAPEFATHFKIVAIGVPFSNYVYSVSKRTYEAADASVHSLQTSADTGILPLAVPITSDITLNLAIGATPLPLDASLVICLGIEFYQVVGNMPYLLSTSSCMQVVKIG